MDGLLRDACHVLSGILNGIDETVWDPAHDPYLAARFDIGRLTERTANKTALQARFGLEVDPVANGVRRDHAADRTERHRPAARRFAGAHRGRRATRLARVGRQRDSSCGYAPLPRRIRAASACTSATMRRWRISFRAAATHCWFRHASNRAASRSSARCATVHCLIVAHVGGLCDTVVDANEMALAAGVATGFHFAPVADGYARRRQSDGRFPCGANPNCGDGCSATPCRPRSAGAGRPERYASLYRELIAHDIRRRW